MDISDEETEKDFLKSKLKEANISAISTMIDNCVKHLISSKDEKLLYLLDSLLFCLTTELSVSSDKKHERLELIFQTIINRLGSNVSGSNQYQLLRTQWILFQIMRKYNMKVKSLSTEELDLKLLLVTEDVKHANDFFPFFYNWDLSDSLLMKVRALVVSNPYFAEVVLNKLNTVLSLSAVKQVKGQNNFDFTVTQCLIHASKSNFTGALPLLNIIGDEELKSIDPVLFKEIVSCLEMATETNSKDAEAYYATVIGRPTYKLAQKLMQTRWDLDREHFNNSLFSVVSHNRHFKIKNCFLMAVIEKKHFLDEIIEADLQVFPFIPHRLRLIYLIHKLYHPTKMHFDQSEWSSLMTELQNCSATCDAFTHADVVLETLVNNLNWIFALIDWGVSKKPSINAESLRLHMFQNFAHGESPLEILHKHGLLGMVSYSDGIEIQQEISRLLSEQKNQSELMIWYGFVAIRLGMAFITSTLSLDECVEFEDIAQELIDVLKNIHPLTFRVEIIENLFSLLFVTVRHLASDGENDPDSDGYNESSARTSELFEISTNDVKPTMGSKTSFGNMTNLFISPNNINFIFPSDVVPKYLMILKEAAVEAETLLYSYQRQMSGESKNSNLLGSENISVRSSISNTEECKSRLKTLVSYIVEAQWRYAVIEPTLTKPTRSPLVSESADVDVSDSEETDNLEKLTELDSPNANDLVERDVSVIPCMLASADQLLRYCLIEGKLEKAKQVFSLFKESLMPTAEACELYIVEQSYEFCKKLKSFTRRKKESKASLIKSTEPSAKGSERSGITTALHDFFLTLNSQDNMKVNSLNLTLDIALTSSPTVALSQLLLEEIFQRYSISHQNFKDEEKLNAFFEPLFTTVAFLADDDTNKDLKLSHVISNIPDSNVFNKPKSFKEEREKLSHLKKLVLNVQGLLQPGTVETHGTSQLVTTDLRRLRAEYEKLIRHCPVGKCLYLRALHAHIRKVSKALVECRKRSESMGKEGAVYQDIIGSNVNIGYFSVLYQSPSVILCSMVLKQDISPKVVDDLARDMKVDLLGTLCSLLCPAIPTYFKTESEIDFQISEAVHPSLCDLIRCYHTGTQSNNESILISNHFEEEEATAQEGTYAEGKICNFELIEYFRSKSVILVETLKLLQLIDPVVLRRNKCDNVLKEGTPLYTWIDIVKQIFGGVAKSDTVELVALALHPKLTANHHLIMKVMDRLALRKDLEKMYKIILHLDSKNVNRSFLSLKTAILYELTKETGNIKYTLQIEDEKTKTDLVLDLIFNSDTYVELTAAVRALKSVISSLETSSDGHPVSPLIHQKLDHGLKTVSCYTKISQLSGLRTWRDGMESLSSIDVLTILKTKKMHALVVEWDKVRPQDEILDAEADELRLELLALSYCEKKDFAKVQEVFSSSKQVTILIDKLLMQLNNFESKSFLINLILEQKWLENCPAKLTEIQQSMLGITLLRHLDPTKRSHYMPLIKTPELIVEQMLMNMEFEALEKSIKSERLIKCDALVEVYAKKAIVIDVVDNVSVACSDMTMISSTILSDTSQPNFIMPLNVPTVDQWVPDNRVSCCMLCKVDRFSMFNRRHHCRRCGRVVCANCSKNVLVIPEITLASTVRVCDDCYLQTRAKSPRKESVTSLSAKFNTIQWLLSPNDSENDTIREEFYYESSPSSSLCLSILRLHTDRRQCITTMIENFCKPLFENLSSNQVDYGLLIDMIKSLLLSAKLLTTETDIDLLNKIDLYLGRVDIVKMLVNENCLEKSLISCVINAENAFLKLQEKLIEMERFELALLMGMKFGLNLKPIWKTWALVCLKNMKFTEARNKYKHCFVAKSKGEGNSINSKLLEEIFEIFEKLKEKPNPISLKDRCKAIRSGQVAIKTNITAALPEVIFEEAYYYLNAYGTKEDLIKFFLRFDMYKEAVETFISESHVTSLTTTFISVLMVPSLTKGCLKKVLSIIHSVDPTHNKTWKYLLSSCKYFSLNGFFSVLHTLQLFMGDYIRAAITQIHYFYLHPPSIDYSQLYTRINHLQLAKQHCRDYLNNKDHLHKGCFVMDPTDVMNQIRTINLQIEITTKFQEKGIKGFLSISEELDDNGKTQSPPTLLDHSKSRKTQLAALVAVECGPSVAESFTLAQQIIKDHNLDVGQVFRFAGRILVSQQKMKELGQFLDCIRACYLPEESASLCDDIVGACLRSCNNPDLTEPLIKLLTSDVNKIDAYIKCGKLKSAYLLAVKLERVVDIKRIHALAVRTNQDSIRRISEMWLNKHEGTSNNGH